MDNASTHKAFVQSLAGFSEEDLADWIMDLDCPVALKAKFNMKHSAPSVQGLNARKRKSWVMQFIREHEMRKLKLREMAKLYDDQHPPQLRFLPPYHPELNPVEKIWRRLKPEYLRLKSLRPGDHWRVRLEEAYEVITPEYLDAANDQCIKWALAKHAEFVGAGRVRRGPVMEVDDSSVDPDSSGSESGDSKGSSEFANDFD